VREKPPGQLAMGMEERLIASIQHPVTGADIPYGILGLKKDSPSSPAGSFSLDGNAGVTLTLLCRWAQLADFCHAALGVNYVDEEGDATRLFRSTPLRCPIRGLTTCFAVRVSSFEGIAGDAYTSTQSGGAVDPDTRIELPVWNAGTQLYFLNGDDTPFLLSSTNYIEYEFAEVVMEFAPLPYKVLADSEVAADEEWLRFTTVERTPRVELLNVKAGTLKWIDDPPLEKPQPVPTDVPIRVQAIDYVVTWHRVPFVITDLDAYVGFANSADRFLAGHFKVPTDGFAKDRMLLLGFREVDVPQPFGVTSTQQANLYTYQFFFQDRANKHNNSLRRKGAEPNGPFTFEHNDYSFTGRPATLNSERPIKHANLAQLFQARS
jgi:hypothetical protein